MNMFAKNSARTVKEYIESVPAGQREPIQFLHEFIQKAAPKLKPHYATNMLGYGSMTYLNLDELKKLTKLGETSPGVVGATVVEDK